MLGEQRVPYPMSPGREKTRIIFFALQNAVHCPHLSKESSGDIYGPSLSEPFSVKQYTEVPRTGPWTAGLPPLQRISVLFDLQSQRPGEGQAPL